MSRPPAPPTPERVSLEIVEKQWGRGILLTHVIEWGDKGRLGHNQEDVPGEVFDQPEGTIVHATIVRDPSDPDEPALFKVTDWTWPGKTAETSKPKAYVWLHPGVKHGTPCVGGTRIPVETIAQLAYGPGGSIQLAIGSYPHLTREQVLVACWYVGMYGTAVWSRRRWRKWAAEHADAMWAGRWNEIPDPPNGDNVQLALGER